MQGGRIKKDSYYYRQNLQIREVIKSNENVEKIIEVEFYEYRNFIIGEATQGMECKKYQEIPLQLIVRRSFI